MRGTNPESESMPEKNRVSFADICEILDVSLDLDAQINGPEGLLAKIIELLFELREKEKEGNIIEEKDREKFEKIKQFYRENNLSYYASVLLAETLERLIEEYKGKI